MFGFVRNAMHAIVAAREKNPLNAENAVQRSLEEKEKTRNSA